MDGFNWWNLAWIAGLVFVYLFGLFEGRGQGYKRRKAEEAQEQKEQPPPAPADGPRPAVALHNRSWSSGGTEAQFRMLSSTCSGVVGAGDAQSGADSRVSPVLRSSAVTTTQSSSSPSR